jgi:hypothetical protein
MGSTSSNLTNALATYTTQARTTNMAAGDAGMHHVCGDAGRHHACGGREAPLAPDLGQGVVTSDKTDRGRREMTRGAGDNPFGDHTMRYVDDPFGDFAGREGDNHYGDHTGRQVDNCHYALPRGPTAVVPLVEQGLSTSALDNLFKRHCPFC